MNQLIAVLVVSVLLQTSWAQTTTHPANGQSASGSGAPLDLLSILGTGNSGGQGVDALLNSIMGGGTPALNQPSTGMTPGGNSLLNSVMGGGGSVPGAAGGMPMGGFAGLAGMGGMGNSIAGRMPPKPATPPTNPLQMMLPAIAYSSGLDGPWGVMAMASAMNGGSGGGGGIASLMKNPMFLMNMMTGGELFSF